MYSKFSLKIRHSTQTLTLIKQYILDFCIILLYLIILAHNGSIEKFLKIFSEIKIQNYDREKISIPINSSSNSERLSYVLYIIHDK